MTEKRKYISSRTNVICSRLAKRVDFFIRQGEHEAWLEHYALSESGYSGILSKQDCAKYRKAIQDKRRLHGEFGTRLLETWSLYNDRRPLLEHLHETLENEGFVLKPRDLTEVYKKIVETGKDRYIYKLILFMMKFIEQYKTAGYDAGGFEILRKKTDNPRTLLFLDIAEQVYHYYQEKLKQNNQIDFADMINDANLCLQEIERQHLELPYRYIIIDEFQDIARQRFTLTKKLSEITKAKVVAVGDDWQSIYAFSGSDIRLFTRFLELMGDGTELKITHTYRNAQELIDIAGGFVQKNTTQIRKQLISPKHLRDPVILEEFDDSVKPFQALAEATERTVGKILDLPEEDPKFDSMLEVIEKKHLEPKNKIMIFSSFKHTLRYLEKKLIQAGMRVGMIHGDVPDEERRALRKRFNPQDTPTDSKEAIDILLFSEVGCEGLDYQFCDCMINYDLPWNPMRVEQRIGRIDRNGQTSESVAIYNMITPGTVDADIYERCLMRIGVFHNSVGDCESILGEITSEIYKLVNNFTLSDRDRREKMQQISYCSQDEIF